MDKRSPGSSERTVLITGCSQGGLGDALAQAFHKRGLRVIATARNPSKIVHFKALGIETLVLDVLSPDSIKQCVSSVADMTGGSLDILLNNSGAGYMMPLADADMLEARKCFELNVIAVIAVTQAFLPLLLKSKHSAMVVNNTSIASAAPVPMQGVYNASKAAAAMLTDNLRVELTPFKIKVVDMRTGGVKSNFFDNSPTGPNTSLPKNSIYAPAREAIEKGMASETIHGKAAKADLWADQVVGDLLSSRPPVQIWRGESAWVVWFLRRFAPYTFMDGTLLKRSGLDILAKKLA